MENKQVLHILLLWIAVPSSFCLKCGKCVPTTPVICMEKNWSCPPGCGTLEECEARVRQYTHGILVQTVGNLEDSMDVETMMETEAEHKKHFFALEEQLRAKYPTMLPIGAGCCTRCKECTYPDNPCRFPDKTFASMEAYGMLVTQVCQDNNLTYYYGPCTITYTSCFFNWNKGYNEENAT